eukprot:TCALIF_14033-PA protein Name:"Protein of unknown function" AED:0.16 eAED:0.16 QI:0/1/0.5/1/1/1/2/55/110
MKIVLFLSVVATVVVLCQSQADGSLKQGDECTASFQCADPLICNEWKNGPKRCQPRECKPTGERCGFFQGRCCTCEYAYCYKLPGMDRSTCTPLELIPVADREQVRMFNV